MSDECKAVLERGCASGEKMDCAVVKAAKDAEPTLRFAHAQRICSEQSVSVCQAACDGGDSNACIEMAQMYMTGARVPHDMNRANRMLREQCTRGSMRACEMHGVQNLVLDPTASAASLKTACESEEAPYNDVSCRMLLNLMDRKVYAPATSERIALFRRMCVRSQTATLTFLGEACGRLKDLGENN
jgi:hypothetical protein